MIITLRYAKTTLALMLLMSFFQNCGNTKKDNTKVEVRYSAYHVNEKGDTTKVIKDSVNYKR